MLGSISGAASVLEVTESANENADPKRKNAVRFLYNVDQSTRFVNWKPFVSQNNVRYQTAKRELISIRDR